MGKAKKQCAGMLPALLLGILFFCSNALAQNLENLLEFRDSPHASDFKVPTQQWTLSEKQKVLQEFRLLYRYAPYLIHRATANGPIRLYRISNNTRSNQTSIIPDNIAYASASWEWRAVLFPDRYFDNYHQKRRSIFFVFTHEMVHLADAGAKLARSNEWNQLIGWRIKRFKQELQQRGITRYQAYQRKMSHLAKKYGLVTVYSSFSSHEALADYAAAIILAKASKSRLRIQVPDSIRHFINTHLLSSNYSHDQSIAHFTTGRHAIINKQYLQARQYLDTAINYSPNFASAYLARGFTWYYTKNYSNALSDFNRCIRLLPIDDPLTANAFLIRSRTFFRMKHYNNALRDVSKSIRVAPYNGKAYYLRGIIYNALKKDHDAYSSFSTALKYIPSHEPYRRFAMLYIGRSDVIKKNYGRAIQMLNKTIEQYPRLAKAYLYRGVAHLRQNSKHYATRDLQRAFALDPTLKRKHQHYLNTARGEQRDRGNAVFLLD